MLKYQLDDASAPEVETQDSETPPDRAAMSLANANLAIPFNLAPARTEKWGAGPPRRGHRT